jgi:hypothetical protein
LPDNQGITANPQKNKTAISFKAAEFFDAFSSAAAKFLLALLAPPVGLDIFSSW